MTSKTFTAGILGGSFNPVHNGHIALARQVVEAGLADEVWLTLSPLNPLKAQSDELIDDRQRLEMLRLAVEGIPGLRVCDIELYMPRPSYTINTLTTLARRYPTKKFKLIIGSDNWNIFDRWRESQRILDEFGVIVYLRPGYDVERRNVDGLEVVDAPGINLSSTFVRDAIENGRDMNLFLPQGVYKYITDNNLYTKK